MALAGKQTDVLFRCKCSFMGTTLGNLHMKESSHRKSSCIYENVGVQGFQGA